MFVNADLVRETSATTGTAAYALAGAQQGFRAFSSKMANTDTCWYCARFGADYEFGLGTWNTGNTLSRTTIFESSNANNAVSWPVGDKDIYIGTPTDVQMTNSSDTLASAATVDLGSRDATTIDISGTTGISSFGTTASIGTVKFVRFQGALTITHNATSMILPYAANIVTIAGDCLVARAEGSGNWRVLQFQRGGTTGDLKVGTFTRDMSLASGNQAVTGVGFK